MNKSILILIGILLFITLIAYPAQSIGGGGPGFTCDHFFNPSPAQWEEDVEIGAKGVQTCINVTVDQDCTVNVTFQWMNWSRYMYDWANWEEGEEWPDYYNESYWTNYSDWTNLNISQRICAYQENVSCYTEGDWSTMWSDWRIIANFTCPQNYTYNETCYYTFTPELCPLFYIHPPSPNGTECPCCINLCVGVNSTLGYIMNITIYSNLSGDWDYFYLGTENVTISNVTNGTYCIMVPYFNRYNYTYYWNVSVDDGHTIYDSNIFSFTTLSLEECVEDAVFCPPLETGLSMGVMGGLLGGILGSFLLIRKKRKGGETYNEERNA